MIAPRLATVEFMCFAAVHFGYWLAWVGSLALSIALVTLMWTRWGQSRPLQKCAALSLLVHLILAFLAMTVRIVAGDGAGGGGGGIPIHVRIIEEHGEQAIASRTTAAAAVVTDSQLNAPALLTPPPAKEVVHQQPEDVHQPPSKKEDVPLVKDQSSGAHLTPKLPQPSEQIVAEQRAPEAAPPSAFKATSALAQTPSTALKPASVAAASPYSLRSAADRLSLIKGQGGNAKTEQAVVAALNWLAVAQSRDGRWSANQFGAGQEQMVFGQNRGGAGRNADTGISALAILVFLGAGHSHLEGEYHDTVQRGLDFLLRSQAADGSLFGDATLYAQMYCHSMATFALAEAEAMSGDRRLEPAVTRAIKFSLAAQNTGTGGWRYRPGDTGDTSQLGWQIMALASAKRAGISLPDQTWNRVERFLRTVQRGNFGGLASYRADSPVSTSMTAEALYCHLVLEEITGAKFSESAEDEATRQLLAELPRADRLNLYYWYYATLALHHRQQSGDAAMAAWHMWNDTLTGALLNTQVSDGPDAGSWNTDTVWGGYGGRVYTTAMAAMCLEVYYRYAPDSNDREGRIATRAKPALESK
ncbi:MAG TPA: squalene--hopene cyclase [Lacipirellulaceae bacterium]|nr:squalene--hopene cyclase [Lacipirellulaceae bacterium]